MTFTPQYPQPAFDRCNGGYNSKAQSAANPLGFDNGGYLFLFQLALQDAASLVAFAANMAQVASSFAAAGDGWASVTAPLVRVSATQFEVGGDMRCVFPQRRALQITQTQSGFGYVGQVAYDGVGTTTVTVAGITLDTGFAAVAVGQAVENAPRARRAAGSGYGAL